jgi:hypothetical protein
MDTFSSQYLIDKRKPSSACNWSPYLVIDWSIHGVRKRSHVFITHSQHLNGPDQINVLLSSSGEGRNVGVWVWNVKFIIRYFFMVCGLEYGTYACVLCCVRFLLLCVVGGVHLRPDSTIHLLRTLWLSTSLG